MPGDFRCLRCEHPCAYFTTPSAHGAAGALGTRHSPRPLFAKGERFLANLGRDAWAETAKAYLDTTSLRGALATKQSSFFICRAMDCFAGARNDGVSAKVA